MRKTLLMALAATAILSVGLFAGRAAATTSAAPAAHPSEAEPIREAINVCGGNGCAPVQTKAQQRRKFQTLGHG